MNHKTAAVPHEQHVGTAVCFYQTRRLTKVLETNTISAAIIIMVWIRKPRLLLAETHNADGSSGQVQRKKTLICNRFKQSGVSMYQIKRKSESLKSRRFALSTIVMPKSSWAAIATNMAFAVDGEVIHLEAQMPSDSKKNLKPRG